jgi:hypothetical protein
MEASVCAHLGTILLQVTCPFGQLRRFFLCLNTVFTMKPTLTFLLLGTLIFVGTASAQKQFEWQPGTDEAVRLDPANYHTGKTYTAGGGIQVDIESQQPVTIFLTGEGEWNHALQYPETMGTLRMLCLREHVVKTRYVCNLPAEAMTLVIRDDRGSPESAGFAGLGEVLKREPGALSTPAGNAVGSAVGVGLGLMKIIKTESSSSPRHFVSPNDVHIQYFLWTCISNCFPPEFRWIEQAKEKYELTSFLKVYGGYTPNRDGEVISIKIKAPMPMLVAVVPSSVANQLHGKPEMLEPALEKNSCQQRGVQSQTFQCTFNVADGPQSLIVAPEDTGKVKHKKAEIEFFASKCVEHCALPPANASAVNP